jgi:asparagine N-glycosylation enzyme membrane subunit Stt3
MVPEVWPALLVSCGLLGPVLWAYWAVGQRLAGRGVPGPVMAVAALVLLVVAAGAAVMLVPGVESWTTRILGMRTELVSELAAEVTSASYWQILGVPGALALIAPIVCLGVAWQKEGELPALFLSLLAVAFLAMWWRTHDFDYLVPVVSAMAAALAVRGLWITMLPERVPVRNLLYAGAAVVALAPIWPLGKQAPPWPTRTDVGQLLLLSEGWVQAMTWMAERTPEPPLPVDARVDPFGDDFDYPPGSYGVLAAWDQGNFVSALGRRPVVVSQGVSPSLARWMMETDEARSIRFWDRARQDGEPIRYVVLDAETLGDHFGSFIEGAGLTAAEFAEQPSPGAPPVYGARYRESIVGRLYLDAADGLSHYRLVYQSPHQSALFYRARPGESGDGGSQRVRLLRRSEPIDSDDDRRRFEDLQEQGVTRTRQGYLYGVTFFPTVRIFELVPGATLVGRAAPGTEVEARLDLASTQDGAALEYRQSTVAGEDGRYRLTVPYATEQAAPTALVPTAVVATGRYRLSASPTGDRRPPLEVDVAEDQVRSGAEILLDEDEETR